MQNYKVFSFPPHTSSSVVLLHVDWTFGELNIIYWINPPMKDNCSFKQEKSGGEYLHN